MTVLFGDSRLPSRFWSKADVDSISECWIWSGSRVGNGYGQIQWNGRVQYSHRVAYMELCGEIAEELEIDHLCRVRACCNPSHMEPVSHRTNGLRGVGIPAQNARKTHCKRGHEFTEENTYMQSRRVGVAGRVCRECVRFRKRKRRERDVAKDNAEKLAHYHENRESILLRRKELRSTNKSQEKA